MIDVTFGSIRTQEPFVALREYMENKYPAASDEVEVSE